jgi:acid stress chaperone HdeA
LPLQEVIIIFVRRRKNMDTRRIAGAILFSSMVGGVALSASVLAAQPSTKTVKPETMTCEEFLALGKEVRPNVVYWIDGYAKSGKLKEEAVEIDTFSRPITVIVDECQKTPKESLWQKVKSYF